MSETQAEQQRKPAGYEDWMFINEAAEHFGYSYAGYIGQLARDGKIDAIKCDFDGRKRVLINPASLQAHRDKAATREAFGGRRTPWRRFILRIHTAEIDPATVQALLEDNLPAGSFTMDKPKIYKAKSKTTKKSDADPNWRATVLEIMGPSNVVPDTEEDEDTEDDFLA